MSDSDPAVRFDEAIQAKAVVRVTSISNGNKAVTVGTACFLDENWAELRDHSNRTLIPRSAIVSVDPVKPESAA